MRNLIVAGLLLLALLAPQAGRAANPELTAAVDGVNDEKASRTDLRIETMDIAVRIHGGITETVVTTRLQNIGQDRLEGRFALQMPPRSVVTGYALDVAGAMIEGVLVDQAEARRAYEDRLRQGVDPGLGEVSRNFQFTTRVYPIEGGSARTVRVRFVTPLDPAHGFQLPLDHDRAIRSLSISVEASGVTQPPRVTLPSGAQASWSGEGGRHRLAYHAGDITLAGSLDIAPPERAGPMLLGKGPGGERFFEIADAAPRSGGDDSPRPRKVAILWDRSLSRGDDDIAAEIALLKAWLSRLGPSSIELLLFDGGGIERVALSVAAAVERRLAGVTYRGATSFAQLAKEPIAADSCLLFTDGLVTLGRRESLRPGCPLSIVSSAADADRSWLGALARAGGGEAIQLTALNGGEALDRLSRPGVRVAEVRSATGAPLDFTLLDAPAGGWRLVGRAPSGVGIVVRLSGAQGEAERVYAPPAGAADWSGAAPLWASDRLAVRAAGDEDRDTLIAFARTHSVAGPDISFLVLETPRDYVEADIAPPSNFPADRRTEYDALKREQAEEEEAERKSRFEETLERWEAQKAWWATRFNPYAKANKEESDEPAIPVPVSPLVQYSPPMPPSPEPMPAPPASDSSQVVVTGNQAAAQPVTVVTAQAQEIAVTGSASPLQTVTVSMEGPPVVPEVTPAEWASDRPYLVALRAARPKDRERVLAEQQARHGLLPAFWLDVSEYYRRAGAREEALRLLLSALELTTRDSETLGLVAERLIRWGDVDTAIALYERMVAQDRQHPHPQRGLALALAKRAARTPSDQAKADLARAIALLAHIVLTVDDDRYEGFDIIALTEVNSMIARYRRLGGGEVPLDPRLIANLDLDLRIVLEWKNETIDVDMWVMEPNGERASYWNDLTEIGGRVSEETSDGSGPEQYMLRRAAPGTYSLKAEVWSEDELNPNGAARVIARLIRDFGRPREREELIEFELPQQSEDDSDDEDAVPIAKIRIAN
jgi:tetratricopeptide (TPR) repeat protein